jgi:hypothetical protein
MDHQQQHSGARRDRDLDELRRHWGDTYHFTWQTGTYTATRRDTGRALDSQTVPWLWELVRADYLATPTPGQP